MRKFTKSLLTGSGAARRPATAAPANEKPSRTTTTTQESVRRTAEEYLAISAFSRTGLIEQLVHDGYSEAHAADGVDAMPINWNEQATRTAKDYLDQSDFSARLIDQLVHEGYTHQQAAYGATQAGR